MTKNKIVFLGLVLSTLLGFEITDASSPTLTGATASIDITPPTGVPLAGFGGGKRRIIPWDVFNKHPYATFLTPSKGKLDPIRAKVFLLQKGDQRLLFIGLDFVAFTAENRADLMKYLKAMGYRDQDVFISSTHTHSGPGTLSHNLAWQLIAADRFQKKIYRRVLEQIVDTVSLANLRLRSVDLFANHFLAEGLQKNRRIEGGAVDRQANLMWIRDLKSGAWLGGLVNLPIHGTALKTDNLYFSSDVNGAIERALEKQIRDLNGTTPYPPTMVFINGAEGDVSPSKGGLSGMTEIAESFAGQTLPALLDARKIDPTWEVKAKTVKLPTPGLNLKGCVSQKTLRSLIWKKLRLSLRFIFPKETRLYSLRLGDMALMTWPGEPTTALGLALRVQSEKNDIRQAWVLGLTNDYLAYWTAPEEYHTTAYEACSSLYGAKGGTLLLQTHKNLLFP